MKPMSAPAATGRPNAWDQDGRIAQRQSQRETEHGGGPRASDPMDDPVLVEVRLGLIAAVAGPGDQLDRLRGVPLVEHRSDAQEPDRRIEVEETGQQARPKDRVQFITEVGGYALPPVQDHAATGTEACWIAAAVACQPNAALMKPVA